MNRNDARQSDVSLAKMKNAPHRDNAARRTVRAGGDQRNGASSLAMAAAFAALIMSSRTYCGGMT